MTSSELESKIIGLTQTQQLIDLFGRAKYRPEACDKVDHSGCFDQSEENLVPLCPDSLIYVLFKTLRDRPQIIDDQVRVACSKYYQDNKIKAEGLIDLKYLNILQGSKHSSTAWLKLETLLVHLIKKEVYLTQTMGDEILRVMKTELDDNLASKLSSLFKECAAVCRQISGKNNPEDEEKWIEIIEWLSWFVAHKDT